MKFNVTLIDPPSYKLAYFLTDTCRTLAYGLRSLGHVCHLTVNNFDISATNVLVGTHLLSQTDIGMVLKAASNYIVFQSEWLYVDPTTGEVCSSFQANSRVQATQAELYTRAAAVWDCLESNGPLLERMGVKRERIRYYVPGFHEELIDIRHRPDADKDIEVLFFGTTTEYRLETFRALQAAGVGVMTIFDAPSAFRNDMIARARVNLVLQASQELAFLSPQRVGYLLNNRCFVLADTSKQGGPLDDLVTSVPREQVVSASRDLLLGGDLPALAQAAFDKFRERPITDVLRRMLD